MCRFKNKGKFLKYKLFLAARSEVFFATKLADYDYERSTPKGLLTQLQNLEVAFKDSSAVRSVHSHSHTQCAKTHQIMKKLTILYLT